MNTQMTHAEAVSLLAEKEEEIATLKQQNAKLRKDAERMNYVCSVTRCDPKMDGNHIFFGVGGRPLKGGNLRSAIDNELIRMYGKPEMPKEEGAAIASAEGKQMTLYEKVMFYWLHAQHKHGLGDDYAEKQVNALSNDELLKAISDALEDAGVELK